MFFLDLITLLTCVSGRFASRYGKTATEMFSKQIEALTSAVCSILSCTLFRQILLQINSKLIILLVMFHSYFIFKMIVEELR